MIQPSLRQGEDGLLAFEGDWTLENAKTLEGLTVSKDVRVLDLSAIKSLDTTGAWFVHALTRGKTFEWKVPEHWHSLLSVTATERPSPPPKKTSFVLTDALVCVGEAVCRMGTNLWEGLIFFGQIMAALATLVRHPSRFRAKATINHIERIAWSGAPIIVLISFLVGAIVAQQGVFQLQRFGAGVFVINLIGILALRELGVLLSAIMVAGRSGSAFTAELGSMKMREEVDALKVIGLDPMEVLVVPRFLALLVSLPILTFLANMAALTGGGLVAWFYAGINPAIFLQRLQTVIELNTFFVGLIKAPFMALIIAVVACKEGLSVEGSAESLGKRVTTAVVRSIFLVIVVDGLFAMFFAAIDY
jgi:phospholipid/cholesterol/gamma-HCH transport system permease protein